MKVFNTAVIVISLLGMSINAYAIDMANIVKAQVVLGQISLVMDKYSEIQALLDAGTLELEVAEPVYDNTGKFLLPFDEAGYPTAWAERSLNAAAGAQIAEIASDKAVGALAAKVPFGGLVSGFARRKSKELGAVTAIGGWGFIKENSSLSFNSLRDYSVYMHSEFNGLPGYEEALAASMAIYPALERSHDNSVEKAYKKAKREAAKLNR